MSEHNHKDYMVTCGMCDRSWCERCDPAPSALCHWCHGRGYSTAPIDPPTHYHEKTPEFMRQLLERIRLNKWRIRLYYGDTDSGKDWNECYDVTGRSSRSMGPCKVPILVYNCRSMGGGAMLDHCIVRIRHAYKNDGGDLYRHPHYHS